MQNQVLKFVLLLFIFNSISNYSGANVVPERLNTADSLFAAKRYTESLQYYDQLYAEGLSSQAMLLKMAYINEGMEQYSDALYFLNMYFLESNDGLALQKMSEIAAKQHLSGYDESAYDLLYGFYMRNYHRIKFSITAIMLLVLSFNIYLKKKQKMNMASFLVLMLVPAIMLVFHLNLGKKWKKGIIMQDKAVVMKGPSAASGVIGTIKAGTRFDIVNTKDSWVVIKTAHGRGYVREHVIRKVEL